MKKHRQKVEALGLISMCKDCSHRDSFYLSEGSLPGISTKRSWSHMICKNVSLQSCKTDWQTPANLSIYNETCKTIKKKEIRLEWNHRRMGKMYLWNLEKSAEVGLGQVSLKIIVTAISLIKMIRWSSV